MIKQDSEEQDSDEQDSDEEDYYEELGSRTEEGRSG
jgi:hypothetical protein